jgi:uncharacterized protein (DUF1330 family)
MKWKTLRNLMAAFVRATYRCMLPMPKPVILFIGPGRRRGGGKKCKFVFHFKQNKPMAAYMIFDIAVHDMETYDGYKKLTPATLALYHGKFVVRGGTAEPMEGDWQPGRIVVLEFPTMGRAKEWWNSPEYTPAKKIRQSAATTKMILVEGFGE